MTEKVKSKALDKNISTNMSQKRYQILRWYKRHILNWTGLNWTDMVIYL